MPATQFVKVAGNDKVYQKLGNGVLDPVVDQADFYRRSGSNDIGGNTQTINSLDEAYLPDIQSQVNAQVDPSLNLANDQATSDTNLAKSNNQRLLDSIAKVYSQKRENDPLAKAGVYSGAADIYNTGQNVDQVTQANQDLTTQLSDIANRLKTTQTNAQTQKTGLTSQLLQQYLGNNQNYQADQNKISPVDLGGQIAFIKPDGTVVKTINKSAAPSSGSASLTTPGSLQSAVTQAVGSGQYTATGEAGKQSREQLINQLNSYYQGKIPLDSIKSAVYSTLTAPGEAAYNPATSAANNTKNAQTQTNVAVAQQALNDLKNASQAINIAPSRGTTAYIKQLGLVGAGKVQGNNSAVAQLGLQGEAILTAIRALTNTGRITQSEINTLKLPTGTDTATEAQTKISALERLLAKAAGDQGNQSKQQSSAAPTVSSYLNSLGF